MRNLGCFYDCQLFPKNWFWTPLDRSWEGEQGWVLVRPCSNQFDDNGNPYVVFETEIHFPRNTPEREVRKRFLEAEQRLRAKRGTGLN